MRIKRNFTLNNVNVTSDFRLFLVLIIYIILGIVLFRYYQYQINTDATVYISTAKSYISGDFYGSISDYWSPLLSWLMIPFLFFGKTPLAGLQAAKIFSIILGFFTIIGVRQLSYRFEMDELVRTVVLFIMIPVVLYFALKVITPDLLMVCISVYYLTIIFDLNYPNKVSNGVLCGILGGLAYLTKSYGFPFFIATFLILNLFQYFKDSNIYRRKKVLKNFIIGFVIFLMISGIWIGLISFKDTRLTIGTAGEINHALFGPQSKGMTILSQGIHNPEQVDPNLISEDWSPFSSWKNFNYQISLIFNNILITGSILIYFSFLSILIILVYILMCIQPPRKLISQNETLYPLVTLIIIASGYVTIVVVERYIWLIYVLLILMGGYLINLIFNKDHFIPEKFVCIKKPNVKAIVLLVFAILFVISPVNYLIQNVDTGEEIYNLSNTLNQYGVHGNVAINHVNLDEYNNMYYLAYYMNITSYGVSQNNITALELRSDLKKYNIDYYFIWGNSNQSSYMQGYNEITNGTIQNLKVYSVKIAS